MRIRGTELYGQPDGGRQPSPRPASPLRNSFTYDTSTGIDPHAGDSDDSDDDRDGAHHYNRGRRRSPSPAASSASNLATSFVQRMSSYVGGIAPKSPSALPSDAELEAEAERERERSRREAEAILTREAQQRKQVQDRMAAMFDSTKNLPPPPSSKPYPTTPSPASSHKESTGWWQATKNRLTPTKDKESPVTPAQQVILDAKAKDKSIKGKDREDTSPNPFTSTTNLNIPVQPPSRKPVPASPSSPTPSRPSLSTPNLSPSPMRTAGSVTDSPSRESPPVYAQFNAQGALDVPGTLLAIAKRFEKLEKWTIGHVRALEDRMNDVERWLVEKESGKDDEKATSASRPADSSPALQQELSEIREEVSELQGRVGELGREMAKMATAPANLSSGPRTQTAAVSVVQRQPSATLVHENSFEAPISDAFTTPRHSRLPSASARESTSPPLASNRTSSGTRLPYPTGDYNSPPDATFSPTNSPPASINSKLRNKSMSVSGISGLPSSSYSGGGSGSPISAVFNLASTLNARPLSPPATSTPKASATSSNAASGLGGRTASPVPAATAKTTSGLPPPKAPSQRQGSVSPTPTPRKRYTVALGGPIVAPPDLDDNNDSLQSNGAAELASSIKRVATPRSALKSLPPPGEDDEDGEEEEDGGETIGKSASARYTRNLTKKRSNASLSSVTSMSSVDKEVLYRRPAVHDSATSSAAAPATAPAPPVGNSGGRRHARAQSVYNLSSITGGGAHFNASTTNVTSTANLNTTAPLRLSKGRSKSSDRLKSSSSNSSFSSLNSSGLGGDAFSGTPLDRPPVTPNSTKFVDPLLLRRKQEVAASTPVGVAKGSGGKLAVGQLVAFFDKERKGKR